MAFLVKQSKESRRSSMKPIEIWMMRYHDMKVLVAVPKVKPGINYLTFTKDPNRKGIIYSFDGDKVMDECTVTSNGKIKCYEIPYHWLTEEEDKYAKRVEDKTTRTYKITIEELRYR